MSRFLYYLILINMLTNMVAITPRFLIAGNKTGTVAALIPALIIGMVLTYFLVRLFSYFPGQGLPEILKKNTPKWIATPLLLFFSLTWYFVGLSILIIYAAIISRFLTPEMSICTIILAFVLVTTFGIFMASRNILYMSEIILLIVVPFILFVQIKGYFSPNLDWDYIRVAIMHINHLPNYTSFSTSLFIVLGAANLVIFNRCFAKLKKPSGKSMVLLSFICTYILLTTYFLPLGFGGFDSLDNVVFPWITTSDSMRMKFGIVERIVFFFIGAFLALGVINITVTWHVSIHLLSSVIHFNRFKVRSVNLTFPIFISIFWIIAFILTRRITINDLFRSAALFDDILLPIILFLLFGSLLLAKRRGAATKCPKSQK